MNPSLCLSICMAALAQQQPSPPSPPPSTPPKQTQPAQPTLDELLGLPANAPKPQGEPSADPATKPAPPAGTAPDTTQRELDRQLQARPVSDDFLKAVSMMQETTQRLRDAQDTGPQTQRLQQEIIKALDKLIEDAKQNQSKSSSSSSSSSSSKSSSQSQSQKQSSQQQQQSQSDANSRNARGGDVSQSQAQAKPPPPGSGAAWGNLPAHVREALQQGFSDEFSSTYQRLTEEYYKRLADSPENRRRGP